MLVFCMFNVKFKNHQNKSKEREREKQRSRSHGCVGLEVHSSTGRGRESCLYRHKMTCMRGVLQEIVLKTTVNFMW